MAIKNVLYKSQLQLAHYATWPFIYAKILDKSIRKIENLTLF